jgi:hypothetical protein
VWTQCPAVRRIGLMSRRCHVYRNDRSPRYLVLWSVHWEVIECRPVESGSDRFSAMMQAIEQARRQGWDADGEPDFGFVFLRRGGVRRLLTLTPRHPHDSNQQSFNPFRA